MRPLGFIWAVVAGFALAGVPLAYLIDNDGVFFALTARVEQRHILEAYIWTCVAILILVTMTVMLGTHNNQNAFLSKPIKRSSPLFYNVAWISCISLSFVLSLVTFASAGFVVPLVELFSDPGGYLLLRSEARANVSQGLLNLNLLFLCPLSVCIAAFFAERRKRLMLSVSVLNIVVVASFSLAKSPIAMALFVIIIFYSCVKPINLLRLSKYGVVMIAVLIPLFMASDSGRVSWAGDRNVLEIVGGRVIYGQWAGLPYFFNIYEKKRASLGTLQPSYLRAGEGGRWSYKGEESPARQAMRVVTGYKDLEGAGVGVAVTFFIGEAYAVWGHAGIIVASVIVGLQLYLVTLIFRTWPRSLWTMFLYSWFTYKMAIGIITGFSAFLFSTSTYLLVLLVIVTFFAHATRRNLGSVFAIEAVEIERVPVTNSFDENA